MFKLFQSLKPLIAGSLATIAVLAVSGAAPASAQMSRQPFQFRVHGNPTAANMAVIMKQVEDGSFDRSSSAAAAPASNGSNPLGAITQYNSTTIGNMNDISTILESGAQGYVNLDTSQDGSQSSQSATSEGTQVYGGNTALGNGNPTVNSTTNNQNDGSPDGNGG